VRRTGNDARIFGPDVITAFRLLGEVINEGLEALAA
jgi:hypothetical protein